jgi:hypothetical protein
VAARGKGGGGGGEGNDNIVGGGGKGWGDLRNAESAAGSWLNTRRSWVSCVSGGVVGCVGIVSATVSCEGATSMMSISWRSVKVDGSNLGNLSCTIWHGYQLCAFPGVCVANAMATDG